MVIKADQARVRDLVAETVTLLCKNGLDFQSEFSIQALIGITLDKSDVFLVSFNETVLASDDARKATGKPMKSDCDLLYTGDAYQNRHKTLLSSICEEGNYEAQASNITCPSLGDGDHAWVINGNSNGLEVDPKSDLTGNKMNVGLASSSKLSPHPKKVKSQKPVLPFPISCISSPAVQQKYQDTSSLNATAAVNSDRDSVRYKEIEAPDIPGMNSQSFADHCIEIKQEADDIDDDMNENAFLYDYNGIDNPGSQHFISEQALIESSYSGECHSDPQEMINSALVHLQSQGGNIFRPEGKGRPSHRRRPLNGPNYRMPRNNVCNICGKAFEKKRDLRGHQAAKHQMQKEHKCEICGKEFSYKRSLTDHIFIIHTRAHELHGGPNDVT